MDYPRQPMASTILSILLPVFIRGGKDLAAHHLMKISMTTAMEALEVEEAQVWETMV